jgi:hypothetical protein
LYSNGYASARQVCPLLAYDMEDLWIERKPIDSRRDLACSCEFSTNNELLHKNITLAFASSTVKPAEFVTAPGS